MLEAANCNFTPIDSPGTGRVGFSDLNAVVYRFYFFVPRDQIQHSSKEKICQIGKRLLSERSVARHVRIFRKIFLFRLCVFPFSPLSITTHRP